MEIPESYDGGLIRHYSGNIVNLSSNEPCAMVNSTSMFLSGDGGADKIIHRASGPYLKKETLPRAPLLTQEIFISKGHNLRTSHVCNVALPQNKVMGYELLADIYISILEECVHKGIRRVIFPCLGTSSLSYPNFPSAKVAISAIGSWLHKNRGKFDVIVFCTFETQHMLIYQSLLAEHFTNDHPIPVSKHKRHQQILDEHYDLAKIFDLLDAAKSK